MVYRKERRGVHLDKLMLCPLKLRMTRLESFIKKVKENSSLNYEKDYVSLELSKVPVQKCLSKSFKMVCP